MAYDNSSMTGDEIFDEYYKNSLMARETPAGWFFYKLWGYSFDSLNDLLDESITKQNLNIRTGHYLNVKLGQILKIPQEGMDSETYESFLNLITGNTLTYFGIRKGLSQYLKTEYDNIIVEDYKKGNIRVSSINNPHKEHKISSLKNKNKKEDYGISSLISTSLAEILIKYPYTEDNVGRITLIKPYLGPIKLHFQTYSPKK